MYEEAKVVIGLLKKREFEAYYIGGKCRNELHNQYHPEKKLEIKDIDIVTNAQINDIKAIFPKCDVRGESFQVAVVQFGGHEFEVATYRKDLYDMKEVKKSEKIVRPKTETAGTLDEDRERRDYTINAVAQDEEGNYIDYNYTYRNKKISAMQDIKDGVIRAIGNPKERIEEDPLRIMRAFRFMAQLGYTIENQTLKVIQKNLNLLEKIPHERISMEMNKLILGQYAYKTLSLMKEIGVFDLTIHNSIINKDCNILPGLKMIDDEYFKVIDYFNKLTGGKDSLIEAWTILLKPLGQEMAKENLESIYALNANDIEKVEWLIQYFDIINSTDMRNDLYDARTGIIKRFKLMCMRELLKKLIRIHSVLGGSEYESKGKNLIDTFCSRPYFPEQLKVTGEQLIEIAGEKPGPWISLANEKIIHKLINTPKFPKEEEKYMEIVSEAVEEAIFEEEMKAGGLLK